MGSVLTFDTTLEQWGRTSTGDIVARNRTIKRFFSWSPSRLAAESIDSYAAATFWSPETSRPTLANRVGLTERIRPGNTSGFWAHRGPMMTTTEAIEFAWG